MSERFGLLYESTFTGSMVGTSPTVFAVWGYVVAYGYGGTVDLHPKVLAAIFGTTEADVAAAIRLHCAPDPDSRTDADEGRRLRHVGGVRYEVVNHDLYKNARSLEEKRAYDRQKKRESRSRQRAIEVPVYDMSKKTVTDADPLFSSSSALPSGSDPEGVQGEGHAPPPPPPPPEPEPELHTALGDWTVPPELYDEAEREHAIGRDELDHRVESIRNRRIGGDGVRDLTAYVRGLLTEWASWEPPKPKGMRKSRPPPAPKRGRPPWVDDSHARLASERGLRLSTEARDFAARRDVPADASEASAAFAAYLRARASAAA